MPFVKPFDSDLLVAELSQNHSIFTLEEGVVRGGLGNIVAHILLESSLTISHFHSFGLPDSYPSIVGDQDYLRMYYKLDTASISSRILSFLK